MSKTVILTEDEARTVIDIINEFQACKNDYTNCIVSWRSKELRDEIIARLGEKETL